MARVCNDRARPGSCQPVPTLHVVPPQDPDYQAYFASVRAAVKIVAHRFRLSPTDYEDLYSEMWVRLLTDHGRALRKFRGRARLETYLVAVAQNLVIDGRHKVYGRWRPTVMALRNGPVAIQLEEFIVRDGVSFEVAAQWFRAARPEVSRELLEKLASAIAPRVRRRHVGPDILAGCEAPGPSPYDAARIQETTRCGSWLSEALARLLEECAPADRDLLFWRYVEGQTVPEIAKRLSIAQRLLYHQYHLLLRRLRANLVARGFESTDVMDVLSSDLCAVHFKVEGQPLPRARFRQSA